MPEYQPSDIPSVAKRTKPKPKIHKSQSQSNRHAKFKRMTISIPENQYVCLQKEMSNTGIGFSELFRRMIADRFELN